MAQLPGNGRGDTSSYGIMRIMGLGMSGFRRSSSSDRVHRRRHRLPWRSRGFSSQPDFDIRKSRDADYARTISLDKRDSDFRTAIRPRAIDHHRLRAIPHVSRIERWGLTLLQSSFSAPHRLGFSLSAISHVPLRPLPRQRRPAFAGPRLLVTTTCRFKHGSCFPSHIYSLRTIGA